MKPEKLELQSADGCQLNLDALYQIAPSCFTEARGADGKVRRVVNFDVLRQLLGDAAADTGEELYQFTWPGKAEARREAARSIRKTLRPVPEDSVDWDTTQNLYIEGDNLEVLKLLQKSYMGKVKMIYIDPPYNTGNDFVYNDDFAASASAHDRAEGNTDDLGNRYRKNTDSNGRFHSDWCSMIYPRLQLAYTLLSEDGVIFISLDDHEIENLTKICNEIFGSDNFIASFPRLTTKSGKTPLTYMVSHDYVLCYAKSLKNIFIGKQYEDESYKYSDEFVTERGNYNLKQPLDCNSISYSSSLDYPIEHDGVTYYPGGDYEAYQKRKAGHYLPKDYAWRWSKDLFEFGLKNGWIVFQNGRIYTKGYLNAAIEKSTDGYVIITREKTRKLSTIDFVSNEFSNDIAKKQVASYALGATFDYPKPSNLIEELLSSYYKWGGSIVLDFFSGSASTAEAVLRKNASSNVRASYIMVQLPELLDESNRGKDKEYRTICDLAKERIRRAGKKIKEEAGLQGQDLDIGFRVFRVDDSNMADVYFQPAALSQGELDFLYNNVKNDRNDLDLLFGVMLDWGVKLSLPLESFEVLQSGEVVKLSTEEILNSKTSQPHNSTTVYVVNSGDLCACFAENITENVIAHIADQSPLRVLFRDSCFKSDADKINIFEQFKQRLGWSDEEAMKNIRVI